ncbi:Dabb family protein [Robiginitalea sp. SC105]|uniref:Dabb family protein n=1 Tax=Robiginitalea sp. SC105 TaxID=2762332 RepID=UPI00163ADDB9|nr:Dabb family protein [Robiginitalea sp. SC105]MBC2839932.1 Dabb family protein [Robiginitalea sp. SC105]
MKPILKSLLFCVVISSGIQGSRGQEASDPPDRILRHVVLFSFKEGTPETKVAEICNALEALQGPIPEIKGFEWGLNNSPEGHNKGFTHCFLLTFYSEEDRDTYLPHPAHKAFGDLAGPHIEDVLVVDYWADSPKK